MMIFGLAFFSLASLRTTATAQGTANPTTDRPMRVSGGVMAGNLLRKKAPYLSRAARCAEVTSLVVLHVIIGKDGTVKSAEVISGVPIFAEPVLEAVREWMYKPFLLNGRPVDVDTTIASNFSGDCPTP